MSNNSGAFGLFVLLCLISSIRAQLRRGALQSRAPPYFGNESTSESLVVHFSEFASVGGGDTVAYELSKRAMQDNDWSVVSEEIGTAGYNISTAQIVSVRVDSGVTITSGTFELGLTRGGFTPDDPEHEYPKRGDGARTIAINYDATAAQMKIALGYLTNVVVREVKRCDEQLIDSSDITRGLGGFEEWGFGCPYGGQGGYKWLVVFDVPLGDVEVPALYTYRNDLQASSWSGSGPQVAVHRITRSMINPNLCLHTKCTYNVTGLESGTPYAFRTRVLTTSAGWTEYSKVSVFRSTLEPRAPTRPKPPVVSSVTYSEAYLKVTLPSVVQNVQYIESNYRACGSHNWLVGETLVMDDYVTGDGYKSTLGKTMILRIKNLKADSQYEARIRAVNHVGPSVWSTTSAPVSTSVDEVGLAKPVTPVVSGTADSLGSNHVNILIQSNTEMDVPAESVTYRLQYRSELQSNWRTYPEPIKFYTRKEGVEIQQILTRRTVYPEIYNGTVVGEIAGSCSGYFYLRLGATSSDAVSETVSSPLPFDATVDQFEEAILTIGKVADAEPRVTAHRYDNTYGGYTWVVEIQGMGDISRLQLYKHTFEAIDISDNSILGDCYQEAPSDPVVTATLQNGNDVYSSTSKVVRVGGLEEQRGYFFRTQVIDRSNHSQPGEASNVTYVKTLPSFSQTDSMDYVGIDGTTPEDRPGRMVGETAKPASGKTVKPSEIVGGSGALPAKVDDPLYNSGAGQGGASGQAGGNGFCAAIAYNARKSQPTENYRWYYTGTEQTFTIPAASPFTGTIEILTIKCWGGGGGGGKISDLTSGLYDDVTTISRGGGGAYAQISLHVQPLQEIKLLVGGGGAAAAGTYGGSGGYGYGGLGGNGINGGGGGGGGLSMVRSGDDILLIAAGGGGGGSSDYFSAGGGAGGGETGFSGNSSEANTPWPLTSLERETAVPRRYEYTSHECPDDIAAGFFCISEWDFLPTSLPAEHKHLQWGAAFSANYTLWSYPGLGGSQSDGGVGGETSSFQTRETGDAAVLTFDNRVAVYVQSGGIEFSARNGILLYGGKGAGGKEGGGGGGAGYYGGGGGGAGIDAAGGGGSSYYNVTSAAPVNIDALSAVIPAPTITFVNESSATLQWTLNWDNTRWGAAHSFDVEIAYGPDSEDYSYFSMVYTGLGGVRGHSEEPTNLREEVATFTATGLIASTTYNLRVVPIFNRGRGAPSSSVVVTTLAYAVNYWEPVVARRLSMIATARGFANPVLDRPHLTPGVEIFDSEVSENDMRFSDPTTAEMPVVPSARRGATLTLIDDLVYMFGGRTDGYSCALTYKDTLDLGSPESGRDVYPCTTKQAEVSELWSWDIHTYKWVFLNTTLMTASDPPPERELHTASFVNGDLYIFGGKTRKFKVDDGDFVYEYHSDVVWGDLWKLDVPEKTSQTMAWPITSQTADSPMAIPEDRRVFITLDGMTEIGASATNGDGTDARTGLCVDKVVVSVKVTHECINQLRISIMGPGANTGSPNFHAHSAAHEVLLYNQRKTNGTGCASGTHSFVFDEDATKLTDECCIQNYQGRYKPEGPLSEFIGSSNLNEWTLVVQDMKFDGLAGTLVDWDLEFTMSECVPEFTWHNLTSIMYPDRASAPPARHSHKALVHDTSFFVFGGHDEEDRPLNDLYRYDTTTNSWTELTPVNFDVALDTSSGMGSNFMLTSWGLLRFGGYHRQPFMPAVYDNYVNDVYYQDPSTLRWRKVETVEWPLSDGTGKTMPNTRYLSAAVFIPSSFMHFKKEFSYRNLYDSQPNSNRANYASALADSVLIFGGHDGATGSIQDGTTGGMLGDMWLLRLSNFSTDGNRYTQQKYLESQCAWRDTDSALTLGVEDCLSATASTNCDFRDMMMLAWCSSSNQTMA